MFEALSDRLNEAFRRITSRGVITESDVRQAMRQVRRALLEADVNFKVVRDFVAGVNEKAVGEKVLRSIDPGKQVIKIVHDEMVNLLGGETVPLEQKGAAPLVYVLVGLQGSGKTTTAAKLARWLSDNRAKRVLLAACDLQRPGAVRQLETLASGAGAGFFGPGSAGGDPLEVLTGAVSEARLKSYDVVVADTAGRLHVDEELMQELERICTVAAPAETLLVLDGLSGQDAVSVAVEFKERIDLTGAVITKMDGDSRGGAALSLRAVTGLPIKFIGTGEKPDGLEPMDPRRLAGRILGMGDVVGLVEKAQKVFDMEEARKIERKLVSNSFTLEDFAGELKKLGKLGSLGDLLGMLPKGMMPKGVEVDESQFRKMLAIIDSMTVKEKLHPEIINGSRRKRIAMGSGTRVSDVNRLLREFNVMKKMMKRIKKGGSVGLRSLFR